jgi:hypothetical protein
MCRLKTHQPQRVCREKYLPVKNGGTSGFDIGFSGREAGGHALKLGDFPLRVITLRIGKDCGKGGGRIGLADDLRLRLSLRQIRQGHPMRHAEDNRISEGPVPHPIPKIYRPSSRGGESMYCQEGPGDTGISTSGTEVVRPPRYQNAALIAWNKYKASINLCECHREAA